MSTINIVDWINSLSESELKDQLVLAVDGQTPTKGDAGSKASQSDLDDKASLSLNHGFVSEYTSRVMQEGGTIQNGRRTAAPFISPTYEDAKMILNASGGLDIADDGGRKVINKIWDSSQEKENQTFAGSDRPEFTDYNGVESVDVEKEGTNFLHPSENLTSWASVDVIVTEQEETIGGYKVFKIDNFVDSNSRASAINQGIPAGTYTVSFYVRASEANIFRIVFDGNNAVSATTEWQKVRFTITTSEVEDNFQIRAFSGTVGKQLYVSNMQIEEGEYPTNYIPTQGSPVTRLAPSPVIQNPLPDSGSVMSVVKMVRSDEFPAHSQYIFSNGGDFNTERSRIGLFSTAIRFQMYGVDSASGEGGASIARSVVFPEWNMHEYFVFACIGWFDETNISLAVLKNNGEIHKNTELHDINNKTIRDVPFGSQNGVRQTSVRGYVPFSVSGKTSYTDAELKDAFEKLTLGTPLQRKAENMTIVP